jgi:hypothetical protein
MVFCEAPSSGKDTDTIPSRLHAGLFRKGLSISTKESAHSHGFLKGAGLRPMPVWYSNWRNSGHIVYVRVLHKNLERCVQRSRYRATGTYTTKCRVCAGSLANPAKSIQGYQPTRERWSHSTLWVPPCLARNRPARGRVG